MRSLRTVRPAPIAPLASLTALAAITTLLAACHSAPRPSPEANGPHGGGHDDPSAMAESGDHGAGSPAPVIRAASAEPIESPGATLLVSGLACPKCASNVDVQLARLPGVQVRNVDMKHGLVLVAFESQPHPTSLQLAKAVADAGLTWRGWSPVPAGGGR